MYDVGFVCVCVLCWGCLYDFGCVCMMLGVCVLCWVCVLSYHLPGGAEYWTDTAAARLEEPWSSGHTKPKRQQHAHVNAITRIFVKFLSHQCQTITDF